MIKELIILYPKITVVFFSLLVTLFMTLVTKYFTKQDRISPDSHHLSGFTLDIKTFIETQQSQDWPYIPNLGYGLAFDILNSLYEKLKEAQTRPNTN